MTTKQVSLRLGEETITQLNYLCLVRHQSQAAVVADLVNIYGQAVYVEAFGNNPALASDPMLVKNGGTIVTVEEQKAVKTVQDRLARPRNL